LVSLSLSLYWVLGLSLSLSLVPYYPNLSCLLLLSLVSYWVSLVPYWVSLVAYYPAFSLVAYCPTHSTAILYL